MALLSSIFVWSQGMPDTYQKKEVLAVVHDFNKSMGRNDSVHLANLVLPGAQLRNIRYYQGNLISESLKISDLAKIGQINKVYDFAPMVDIRSVFATVFTYFSTVDDRGRKTCGTDYFQLVFNGRQWNISDYTSTIFNNCHSIEPRSVEIDLISSTLNEWHGLAAVGDTTYFDHFDSGSYYLGTDAKEIWTLQQFKDFALPYFRRGSAWNFKTKSRNIHLADYANFAWFDENLDTWMGLCRGTGVMEKQADGWKIKHYSLTILVPNSKINDYLKLINPNK